MWNKAPLFPAPPPCPCTWEGASTARHPRITQKKIILGQFGRCCRLRRGCEVAQARRCLTLDTQMETTAAAMNSALRGLRPGTVVRKILLAWRLGARAVPGTVELEHTHRPGQSCERSSIHRMGAAGTVHVTVRVRGGRMTSSEREPANPVKSPSCEIWPGIDRVASHRMRYSEIFVMR